MKRTLATTVWLAVIGSAALSHAILIDDFSIPQPGIQQSVLPGQTYTDSINGFGGVSRTLGITDILTHPNGRFMSASVQNGAFRFENFVGMGTAWVSWTGLHLDLSSLSRISLDFRSVDHGGELPEVQLIGEDGRIFSNNTNLFSEPWEQYPFPKHIYFDRQGFSAVDFGMIDEIKFLISGNGAMFLDNISAAVPEGGPGLPGIAALLCVLAVAGRRAEARG